MIKLMLIIMLLFIFFQDLKYRAVYWFLFPIIFALAFILNRTEITWMQLALNLSVLSILMLCLTAYLSLKFRKLTNPMKGFFALGDVLFLLSVLPLFNTYSYLFYFTTGTCFVLLVHLTLQLLKKSHKEIPFAGYMAFYLVGVLVFFDLYQIPLI